MNGENKEQLPEKKEETQLSSVNQSQMPTAWQTSTVGLENRRKAQQNIGMKHGMFASVPIICKGRKCPYFETCWIPENDLQIGERCPIEIGAIVERFDRYCNALGIDPEKDEDIVDAGYIKEIVDMEVMMLRADSLLAKSGNFIEEVIAGVTPKGQEYKKPELHIAADYKERLRKERSRLLNELNATRKNRKDELFGSNDPSSVASRIIQKVEALKKSGRFEDIVDAEYEELDDENKE